MAQILTVLPIILIFAVFKPIVCTAGRTFGERRDRAPYIESSEYSPQHLSDLDGSRARKGTIQQSKEQESANQALNPINMSEPKDSLVDKNIRSVFSTDFGPGLHLFNNTAPFVNEPNFKSYNEGMVGDEPYPSTTSSPAANKEFFKVQRSPDGKLNVVYNETVTLKGEKDSRVNLIPDQHIRDSTKGDSNNRLQSHNSSGLALKNETTNVKGAQTIGEDNKLIANCLEEDEIKNNKTYCSNLRNYPKTDHLEQLIEKKFKNLEAFFGEDLIVPETIDHRMGNDPNEEFFCKSRQVVIYPQSGQNENYEWFYIVNSDKFKQGIRIEECLNPFKPCGEHVGLTLPSYYKTSCEQHYIYRTLVAYDDDKDTIFKETFRLPACCKCVLRNKLKLS